jgi:VWFA-related protein
VLRGLSFLTVALLVAVPAAQSVSIAQKDTATAPEPASRTIRIEAIVTDKHGKPVVDLRPADFAVFDNGVTQKVTDVQLTRRAARAGSVGPVDTPSAINSPEDEERAAREPGTRVIAVYLDEFHVSAGASSERVRDAVSRFITEQVRPSDLVVVLKPLDQLTSIRFTRDRDAARKIVESFSGHKDDYAPRTQFEEQYIGTSPVTVRRARAQIVMSGLRALASRIGEFDAGLAGIVLVTEGFNTDVPKSRDRRLADLQSLVRTASRSRALVYALDPSPSPFTGSDAADTDTVQPESVMSAFQSVARQTGGDTVPAGGDLVPGLQRVSSDLDTYYVVTFTSAATSDGRFHDVRITSGRKDAQVRSRAGYWAPFAADVRTTTRLNLPPIVPMRAVRRSPLIESWLGMMMETDGRRRILFTWTPANVVSRPGKSVGRPEIVALKVTTLAGAVLFEGEVTPVRGSSTVTGQRTDAAVFAADTGRLQLDLTIFQADGTKLDVGSQDFDVPELRPGRPVILPIQLFRAASAREFREISADLNAAPLPGREFRRTETLLLRVPTFDASGNTVTVSARLLNPVGSTVAELTPLPIDNPTAMSQFDLSLARFAPGEYSIEIAAQSASGVARELIRLRITG